jgi:hypothetical protein
MNRVHADYRTRLQFYRIAALRKGMSVKGKSVCSGIEMPVDKG